MNPGKRDVSPPGRAWKSLSLHQLDGKVQRSWTGLAGKWVEHPATAFTRSYQPQVLN